MQTLVEQAVADLKVYKIPLSAVEKDLGFSNGLIGKAAKGKTNLSDEKTKLLRDYMILASEKFSILKHEPTTATDHTIQIPIPASNVAITTTNNYDPIIIQAPPFNEPVILPTVQRLVDDIPGLATADTIPEPKLPKWAVNALEYCNKNNMTVDDLIEYHKAGKANKKTSLRDIVEPDTKGEKSYTEKLWAQKMGIK